MKIKVSYTWPKFHIDASWSLFLDRDGVINRRIVGDYVRSFDQFIFLPGVLEALPVLTSFFNLSFIVTNQAGIDKGLFSQQNLDEIHQKMLEAIEYFGAYIDNVYACPYYFGDDIFCRKPNPGMAFQAKQDFPDVDFQKSLMVGDSASDIAFGNRLGMKTILLGSSHTYEAALSDSVPDAKLDSLTDVALWIESL